MMVTELLICQLKETGNDLTPHLSINQSIQREQFYQPDSAHQMTRMVSK